MPIHLSLIHRCLGRLMGGIASLLLFVFTLFFTPASWAEPSAPVTAERRKELVVLVRQDCGSCHGLTLKGGLGPSLLPDALVGKPADYLKVVILQGRPSTAMPPWQRFLSDAEAEWIVSNLQKGFPL